MTTEEQIHHLVTQLLAFGVPPQRLQTEMGMSPLRFKRWFYDRVSRELKATALDGLLAYCHAFAAVLPRIRRDRQLDEWNQAGKDLLTLDVGKEDLLQGALEWVRDWIKIHTETAAPKS